MKKTPAQPQAISPPKTSPTKGGDPNRKCRCGRLVCGADRNSIRTPATGERRRELPHLLLARRDGPHAAIFVSYIIYQNFAPIFENIDYIIRIPKLYIIYFEKTIDTGAVMLYNVLKKRQGGHHNVHHFRSQVYALCTGYRSPL